MTSLLYHLNCMNCIHGYGVTYSSRNQAILGRMENNNYFLLFLLNNHHPSVWNKEDKYLQKIIICFNIATMMENINNFWHFWLVHFLPTYLALMILRFCWENSDTICHVILTLLYLSSYSDTICQVILTLICTVMLTLSVQ